MKAGDKITTSIGELIAVKPCPSRCSNCIAMNNDTLCDEINDTIRECPNPGSDDFFIFTKP